MKVYGRMTVFPIMPIRISRLYELAYNLWWSWRPEARALYSTLNPDLWEEVGHNPVRFLSEVQPQKLEQAAENAEYLQQYDSVFHDFDAYMHPRPEDTWFSRAHPELTRLDAHHLDVRVLDLRLVFRRGSGLRRRSRIRDGRLR